MQQTLQTWTVDFDPINRSHTFSLGEIRAVWSIEKHTCIIYKNNTIVEHNAFTDNFLTGMGLMRFLEYIKTTFSS